MNAARRAQLGMIARVPSITFVIAMAPRLFEDIRVNGYSAALIAAVVYVLLGIAIGWLVRLPVAAISILPGLLTLGLFFFLVPIIANAILLKLAAAVLSSFDVASWTAAFLLSLTLRAVEFLLERIAQKSGASRSLL
jgi:putative membrane protein